jgi:hypothetical protein
LGETFCQIDTVFVCDQQLEISTKTGGFVFALLVKDRKGSAAGDTAGTLPLIGGRDPSDQSANKG